MYCKVWPNNYMCVSTHTIFEGTDSGFLYCSNYILCPHIIYSYNYYKGYYMRWSIKRLLLELSSITEQRLLCLLDKHILIYVTLISNVQTFLLLFIIFKSTLNKNKISVCITPLSHGTTIKIKVPPLQKQNWLKKHGLIVKGKFTWKDRNNEASCFNQRPLRGTFTAWSVVQVVREHDPIIPSHSHDAVYTALPLTSRGEH